MVINLESLLCPVRFRYLSMAASHCGLMYSVFHLVNVSVDQVESPLLKIRTLWSDARFRFLLSRYFSDEYKRGELKSGKSHKTVKSRKQAIAIGLSKAREEGAKVPANSP